MQQRRHDHNRAGLLLIWEEVLRNFGNREFSDGAVQGYDCLVCGSFCLRRALDDLRDAFPCESKVPGSDCGIGWIARMSERGRKDIQMDPAVLSLSSFSSSSTGNSQSTNAFLMDGVVPAANDYGKINEIKVIGTREEKRTCHDSATKRSQNRARRQLTSSSGKPHRAPSLSNDKVSYHRQFDVVNPYAVQSIKGGASALCSLSQHRNSPFSTNESTTY